ncbi:MAG: hypothetical protein HY364_03965 [Candidatus Aenigmarchaeota archaeon]|nr:hypothetical protein [Candidatus Aenigmarchaeota archaeon]
MKFRIPFSEAVIAAVLAASAACSEMPSTQQPSVTTAYPTPNLSTRYYSPGKSSMVVKIEGIDCSDKYRMDREKYLDDLTTGISIIRTHGVAGYPIHPDTITYESLGDGKFNLTFKLQGPLKSQEDAERIHIQTANILCPTISLKEYH